MRKGKVATIFINLCVVTVFGALSLLTACATTSPTPPATPVAPAPAPAPPPAAPIVLKGLTSFATNSPSSDPVKALADRLSKATNGALVLNYVGGPEVTPALNQPQAVKSGAVDFTQGPPGYYANLLPAVWAAELCQLNPIEQRAKGIYDYWVKVHQQMNVRYLGSPQYGGQFYIYTNTQINNPKTDFKGMKIRSSYSDENFIKSLGGVPTTVVPPEVYSALQTGVVDAAVWAPDNFITFKAYEVTKYWVNYGFMNSWLAMLMNQDKFNSIPKNLQDILLKLIADLEVEWQPKIQAQNRGYLETYPTKGMKPITFSPEDAKWFMDLCYSAEWADKVGKIQEADLNYQKQNFVEINPFITPALCPHCPGCIVRYS